MNLFKKFQSNPKNIYYLIAILVFILINVIGMIVYKSKKNLIKEPVDAVTITEALPTPTDGPIPTDWPTPTIEPSPTVKPTLKPSATTAPSPTNIPTLEPTNTPVSLTTTPVNTPVPTEILEPTVTGTT